ncbi:hypothetical protein QE152_g9945 [Popillia japonica]|uniref:Uncharacterized protein n=1 Tax=Popillia japonica TaxID=7064 RepID=A0AAW1LWS2_POPJA
MKFILVLALISVEIAASHEDKSKHHRHKISKEAPHEKDLQRKSVRIHPEHQPTIFPPDDHNEVQFVDVPIPLSEPFELFVNGEEEDIDGETYCIFELTRSISNSIHDSLKGTLFHKRRLRLIIDGNDALDVTTIIGESCTSTNPIKNLLGNLFKLQKCVDDIVLDATDSIVSAVIDEPFTRHELVFEINGKIVIDVIFDMSSNLCTDVTPQTRSSSKKRRSGKRHSGKSWT